MGIEERLDRVVPKDVGERIFAQGTHRHAVDVDISHEVSRIGGYVEHESPTGRGRDGSRGSDRSVRARAREHGKRLEDKTGFDRMVRRDIRKGVVRDRAYRDAIDMDVGDEVPGI